MTDNPTPADIAPQIEPLSVAEAHGWTVMDHLDPELRAALMARIDADTV